MKLSTVIALFTSHIPIAIKAESFEVLYLCCTNDR